jgi:PAS domain S-box-containing protein
MPQLAELQDFSIASVPGVGHYVWDVPSDTLYWSKGLLDVYGLTAPPCGESGFYSLLHPEDRVRVEAETASFLETGSGYDHRFRIVRPDGRIRTIIDRGTIERHPDGPALTLRGINIDVTERDEGKAASSGDQKHGDAFRLLADNVDQFVWIANASGWIYWYNKRWLEFTGASLEDMAGWGWRKVHHPDHVNRVVEKITRCFETGEPWQDLFPLRRHDGEYRWFLSRALPVRDDTGAILYWFGTNTDVSEQRRSEAHFRTLAESVPQLVWTADAGGAVEYYNSRIADFYDARDPETNRWDWSRIIHPDDLDGTVTAWRDSADHRAPYSHAHRLRMGDGSFRWHLSRAVPLIGEDGGVERWFGTATDIDEIKQAQILRQVLLEEAHHRIKNMLTMVQSLARLSMQAGGATSDTFKGFSERLDSLAAAHSVLVQGLDGDAGLFDIVAGVATACGIAPERVSCVGDDHVASRDTGLMISLALHELFTNAMKYGALSADAGRIEIACGFSPEGLAEIVWTELGGPPVAPRGRRGLGSQLIERALASAIKGKVTMDFRPVGLVCVIAGMLGAARPKELSGRNA